MGGGKLCVYVHSHAYTHKYICISTFVDAPRRAPGGDGLAVENHHVEEGVQQQNRVGPDALGVVLSCYGVD